MPNTDTAIAHLTITNIKNSNFSCKAYYLCPFKKEILC